MGEARQRRLRQEEVGRNIRERMEAIRRNANEPVVVCALDAVSAATPDLIVADACVIAAHLMASALVYVDPAEWGSYIASSAALAADIAAERKKIAAAEYLGPLQELTG
jgi:hypothetical protein